MKVEKSATDQLYVVGNDTSRCQTNISSLSSEVHFVPHLSNNARVIIPISFARYDGNSQMRNSYDASLAALLSCTACLLKEKSISS